MGLNNYSNLNKMIVLFVTSRLAVCEGGAGSW